MHQYLFFIGNFPIRMYGIMLCIAIFMASSVAYFLAWRDGRGWEQYLPDIGIYGGFCGLVGARLWDVFFFDWAYYSHHLSEIPFVWQGGMKGASWAASWRCRLLPAAQRWTGSTCWT